MSESHFIIILGRGDYYTGDGIVPDRVLSFYDDKLVWTFNNLDNLRIRGGNNPVMRRIFTSREHIMDDALLAGSLFLLVDNGIESYPSLKELVAKTKAYFDYDIYTNNVLNCLDGIPSKKLRHLYNLNKIVLKEFHNLKYVAISLTSQKLILGDSINSAHLSRQFVEAMKNYELINFELCQTSANMYMTA